MKGCVSSLCTTRTGFLFCGWEIPPINPSAKHGKFSVASWQGPASSIKWRWVKRMCSVSSRSALNNCHDISVQLNYTIQSAQTALRPIQTCCQMYCGMFKPLHIMLDRAPGRAHYSELDDATNLIGKGHGDSMTLRSGVADMVSSSPCPLCWARHQVSPLGWARHRSQHNGQGCGHSMTLKIWGDRFNDLQKKFMFNKYFGHYYDSVIITWRLCIIMWSRKCSLQLQILMLTKVTIRMR
jgi:hypothetical protein